MSWVVTLSRKAEKQARKLPENVRSALFSLMVEIRNSGPVRGNWPNYGKLANRLHHCHIKKGKPSYVAVWEEVDGQVQLAEVTYVGTHEKAPY